MLPKLHKSRRVDEIILEYIHVKDETISLDGRPISSGPCYFTRGLSLIVHAILLPIIDFIPHILKDTFDFVERFNTTCTADTLIATWDIESLYTNLRHDLCIRAIQYWLEIFHTRIPLISRFNNAFLKPCTLFLNSITSISIIHTIINIREVPWVHLVW